MLQLVRTDHVLRYHLYMDTEAAKFDAFRVELLEQTVLLTHDTPEALWAKVPVVVQEMRVNYAQRPLYPSHVFSPFARIVALDLDREIAELSVRNGMMTGECHPVHEDRVRALAASLDALEFLGSQPAKRPHAVN